MRFGVGLPLRCPGALSRPRVVLCGFGCDFTLIEQFSFNLAVDISISPHTILFAFNIITNLNSTISTFDESRTVQ